jgi:hypothetical protein
MKKIQLLLLILLLLFSCQPKKSMIDDSNKPEKIAILPAINHTTDVKGGIVFRNLFYLALEEEEFSYLTPLVRIDSLLNDEGITDGGQLSAVENEELFQMLDVDGLLFINLLACEYQTLGISEKREVKAAFKIILPPSELLWETDYEVDHGKSVFDTIFDFVGDPDKALKETSEDLGKQLAVKGSRMWLLDHELKPEMEEVISEVIDSLLP